MTVVGGEVMGCRTTGVRQNRQRAKSREQKEQRHIIEYGTFAQ